VTLSSRVCGNEDEIEKDGAREQLAYIPRRPNAMPTVPVRHRVHTFDREFEQDLKFINRSREEGARCVQRATKKSWRWSGGQIGFDGFVAIGSLIPLGRVL
jgi:hypothetical protein